MAELESTRGSVPTGYRVSPTAHLFLLAAVALATGLTEAGVLLARRFGGGQFIWTGLHVVWMAPLSYLMFFAVPAVALAVAASRWRGPGWLSVTVFLATAVAIGSLIELVGGNRIHLLAMVVLAVGGGLQAARLARARPERVVRSARRATLVLAGVVTVFGVGLGLTRVAGERARVAELPPAKADAPNVLLLILDTVRAASMSVWGYDRPTTPALEAWAAKGVVFDWAIAPSPWTLPSHASMFTGRYAHELSTGWLSPLDDRTPTVAEAFRAAGYLTAAFTANFYYTTRETGLARGFDHFEARIVSPRQIVLGSTIGQKVVEWRRGYSVEERLSDRRNASRINGALFEWLDARNEARPFFIFTNYFDAHRPTFAPAEFRALFGGRPALDGYDASIAYLDAEIDSLLSGLEARGLLENTVVVITSDHGELLGEHGLRGHGNSLFLPLLHVPLLILAPDAPAGRRVGEIVGLHDLAATLTALAGVEAEAEFPGQSLARFWNPGARRGAERPIIASVEPPINAPARQPASRGPMYSVIGWRQQYILGGDGREELYDLEADPRGDRDVANTSRGRTVLPRMRSVLHRAVGVVAGTGSGPGGT